MTRERLKDETGSVAVITALCMTILVGVLAFVLNSGFLYAEKNRYQNAVEAAAMAGAVDLCGEDPEATAEAILQENLTDALEDGTLPEGYTVEVAQGYYDETGQYDFSGDSAFGYRSFVEADNMPSDVYVNSLLVRLTLEKGTVLSDFVAKDKVPFQVTGVAYLKRYGLLSLGEESGDGIFTERKYATGYPAFYDMGALHSNSDIDFSSVDHAPVMDANTTATAVGSISNCPGGDSYAEPVYYSRTVAQEMEDLRNRADYVIRFSDWDPGQPAPNNNFFYHNLYRYGFGFHGGDHGGAVYYFMDDGTGPQDTLILTNIDGDGDDSCATNFTIASELPVGFYQWFGGLHLGGEGEDMVYVVCIQDIGANDCTSMADVEMKGVVFRTQGTFHIHGGSHPSGLRGLWLRAIAGRSIILEGHYYSVEHAFYGNFGPPCPPTIVKLGRLEPSE